MNPEIQKAIELIKEHEKTMTKVSVFLKEKDVPLGCTITDLKIWVAEQLTKCATS